MEKYMEEALREARAAAQDGDVPVGCFIVRDGQIVGRGRNRVEADHDPTAHAEIAAIREAVRAVGRERLTGCTMYVTLEPCSMCAGAIVLARVDRLVIAASDPKTGACGSVYNIVEDPKLNHRVEVIRGMMEEEAAGLLKEFFADLRLTKKEKKGNQA